MLVGESSAALDVRVYTRFYPSEVAGLALVNWADPTLFLDLRSSNGKRAKRIPQLIYQSQDAAAQLFNWVGLYRLGPVPPAPAQPKGLTAAEWNTIWFLTHSSRAISALMQDIASWRLSSAEARAVGNLGDRPLVVLSAGNIAAPPEFLEDGRGRRVISPDCPRGEDRSRLAGAPATSCTMRPTPLPRPCARFSQRCGRFIN